MDIKAIPNNVSAFFKKYRFAILILCLGVVLMTIPVSDKKPIASVESNPDVGVGESMEQRLADVLCQIKGAGKVQVMLTESAGEEVLYQTDNNSNSAENTNADKRDTVIISDGNRNQSGLVRQINPPGYRGAVVVCQGADNPTVQLAIVDAVSKLTGLGANRISVLKMK